jgi:hypothetical protein
MGNNLRMSQTCAHPQWMANSTRIKATCYFLTAALDDEVLMKDDDKKVGQVMSGKAVESTAYDRDGTIRR